MTGRNASDASKMDPAARALDEDGAPATPQSWVSGTSCSPSGSSSCPQKERVRTSPNKLWPHSSGTSQNSSNRMSECCTKHPWLDCLQPPGTPPPLPHVVMLVSRQSGCNRATPKMGLLVVLPFDTYGRPPAALRPQARYWLATSAFSRSPCWTIMQYDGELHKHSETVEFDCSVALDLRRQVWIVPHQRRIKQKTPP